MAESGAIGAARRTSAVLGTVVIGLTTGVIVAPLAVALNGSPGVLPSMAPLLTIPVAFAGVYSGGRLLSRALVWPDHDVRAAVGTVTAGWVVVWVAGWISVRGLDVYTGVFFAVALGFLTIMAGTLLANRRDPLAA